MVDVRAARVALLLVALSVPILSGCIREGYVAEYEPPPVTQSVAIAPWPNVEDAVIRPGVQVFSRDFDEGGQCTSNFLFRSKDNATLYLGLAAHCFGNVALGTPVAVAGIERAGTIAYNAWDHVNRNDDAELYDNDFGLVRIEQFARAQTHPAVLHFGGPTALADSAAAVPGTQVMVYGHSSQRSDRDTDNPRQGYVFKNGAAGLGPLPAADPATTENQILVKTDHPGIQGDSGSGLMTADGQALGVLSLGTNNPAPQALANRDAPSLNFYVRLDTQLALAKQYAALDVELVTWGLLAGPDFPGLP